MFFASEGHLLNVFLSIFHAGHGYVSWAFHCAHTTAQTYGFLDHSTAVFYFYRTGCTGLLADSTADTADVTLFLCFCTFFLIGTFYHNVVCTLMDMNHFLRADFRAGTTANAFLLIHFRHTILIDGNGSEFTFILYRLYIRYIHLHSRPHLG